jgi:hypothetical protein
MDESTVLEQTQVLVSFRSVAQLLGQANTQILPTYVKPLDENTKAVINTLGIARNAHSSKATSIQ